MNISKMATLEVQRGEDWLLEFFLWHLGGQIYTSFVVCHTILKKRVRKLISEFVQYPFIWKIVFWVHFSIFEFCKTLIHINGCHNNIWLIFILSIQHIHIKYTTLWSIFKALWFQFYQRQIMGVNLLWFYYLWACHRWQVCSIKFISHRHIWLHNSIKLE